MVVALVALVFATTGVAGAATGVLPNPLPLQKPPTTVVYNATAVGDPGFPSAEVHCHAGERLVGGSTASNSSGSFVWSSHPVTAAGQFPGQGQVATGWAGSISEPDGQGGDDTVTVYAVCER
ncbi:MAG: hypothetical protein ACRDKX_01105 [Solirubrobacterales bacterium]